MATIQLRGVTKRFGRFTAVDAVDLDIREGEFLTLLGPSGCGKTTTLRMIAGLEDPDEGEIHFDESCVFSSSRGILAPPGKRGIGMIFQSYALWPHMTVMANVTFGLEERRLSKEQIRSRAMRALEVVQLGGLEYRYPSELSGGQQQRVALARVLAVQPTIFLMDEPLSNLDAKLRIEMRGELKRLHVETGTTTVYVTHDQYEALTMSDRIAVMRDGVIQQLATPRAIYERPANLYIANFVGTIPINVIRGLVRRDDGRTTLVARDGLSFPLRSPAVVGSEVIMGIRPEHLEVVRGPSEDAVPVVVRTALAAGSEGILQVRAHETDLMVKHAEFRPFAVDEQLWVRADPRRVLLFDPATEEVIAGESLARGASDA
jgi:multiple sugar transport system ATP-binding protein